MEIYKDLSSPSAKEFENLLIAQLSKVKIEEGNIIEGVVTKITDKFVFIFVEGLKSEPILDINELKTINLLDRAKIGSKIPVLLEKIEDRNGNVLISAIKAFRIKGWKELEKAYETNKPIMGKITSKCKGGVIVEHIDTGSLMFCPGSQIDTRPLKDINHLMNEPQKFALIKLDRIRGNACVSRRQILSDNKKDDKIKIIEKYKVGDVIKGAVVKGYSSFGCFFDVNNGELDVLVHLQEISYSRVNHPDEVFNIGEKRDLLVITVDKSKLQIGCSIKKLLPDPFDHISNYEIGKKYDVKIVKLTDYGAFAEIESGLSTLLHNSEISWTRKNASAKKIFKVNDIIPCVITQIDKTQRRIAISYRLTKENPYELLRKNLGIGGEINGIIKNMNEYAIYVSLDDYDIDGFLHANDLSYVGNPDEEIKKYKNGSKLKVKILEIKEDENKVRVGLKQTGKDPFDWFKDKKINEAVTVKILSTDTKGLIVKPEYCDLEFLIKKSNIAINSQDCRPSRFIKSDRIDAAISELEFSKRKANFSIKLLEELQNKEALRKGSNLLSGRQLPFSSLSDKLDDKSKKKTEE